MASSSILCDRSMQSGQNQIGTRLDLLPQNTPDRKVRLVMRAAWLHRCGVARLLARRTAVWQSEVRFPTWHPHGGLSPLSGTCDEKTQRDFNEWRWMYVKNGKINKNIYIKQSGEFRSSKYGGQSLRGPEFRHVFSQELLDSSCYPDTFSGLMGPLL